MKKTTIGLFVMILAFAVLIGTCSISESIEKGNKKADFLSLQMEEKSFDELVETRSVSKKPVISELVFNGYTLLKTNDGKFYYSLVDSEKNKYNPTIEFKTDYYRSEDIEIAVEKKLINDELIEKNETIRIVAYTDDEYSEYSLVCTSLPLMEITCNNFPDERGSIDVADSIFTIFDNSENCENRLYTAKGDISVRGFSSQKYPKRGYSVNTNKDTNFFGLREGDDYVLYAGYNDQEKIRNVFSSNLWYFTCSDNNSFDIKAGMYYEYIELLVNGNYWGLYAIGFPVDGQQLKIEMNQNKPGYCNENLYKKNNPDYTELNFNFKEADLNGYATKVKKKNDLWQPLLDYYDVIINSHNTEEIYNIVDIDNAIDISLFFNLIQGFDNYVTTKDESEYLYNLYIASKDYEDSPKILFIPWDMDRTWGEEFEDDILYEIDYKKNCLFDLTAVGRLIGMGDEDIHRLISERYWNLRSEKWSDENIVKMLASFENSIYKSGAFRRDIERWEDSVFNDPEVGLKEFKEYVLSRLHYLDENIEEIFS